MLFESVPVVLSYAGSICIVNERTGIVVAFDLISGSMDVCFAIGG